METDARMKQEVMSIAYNHTNHGTGFRLMKLLYVVDEVIQPPITKTSVIAPANENLHILVLHVACPYLQHPFNIPIILITIDWINGMEGIMVTTVHHR